MQNEKGRFLSLKKLNFKMRKGFFSALLALAMAAWGTSAAALETDGNGVYQIRTAEDLIAFSALINAGTTAENTQSAVITAPIDMKDWNETFNPIGKNGSAFAGNFDGRLQPITNLNKVLFGTINGAQITGIAIASGEITMSATTYATHCGSIVGTDNGNTSVLANSYSLANVTNTITKSSDTGGLVGKLRGTLKNCYFAGAVTAAGGSTGALVGSTTSSTVASNILNCYSFATSVTGGGRQGALVGWLHKLVTEKNCCAIADVGTFPNGYTTLGAPVENCQVLTAEQFASGMAAYLLNEGDTENPVFRQTIGSDSYPVFDDSHGIVYQSGRLSCDGSPKEGVVFSNTKSGDLVRDEHNFVDGLCTVCQTPDLNYLQKSEDGFYELENDKHWAWFTAIVNGKYEPTANARLMNFVHLGSINQQPIGTPSNPYKGTFDGQMNSIAGVSHMLFGTIDGATIKNVALTGGGIELENLEYAAHCGSIVGATATTAPSAILNCYSLINISNQVGGDTGGLAGKFFGEMKNCYFAGEITALKGSLGALVGSSCEDKVTNMQNCFAYVEVIEGGNRRGALVGWLHGTCSINKCYAIANVGTFPNAYTTVGATVNNCESLTIEEIAGGKLTYKLNGESIENTIFYQTLGVDAHPVLDNTHGFVYPLRGGFVSNSRQDYEKIIEDMRNELAEYADTTVACTAYIEQMMNAMDSISTNAENLDSFVQGYVGIKPLIERVKKSEETYQAYTDARNFALNYLAENSFKSEMRTLLETYLSEEIAEGEHSEKFANGTYLQIIGTHELNDEEIVAETAFLNDLLQRTIATNILPGTEITVTIPNYDFSNGLNGWDLEAKNKSSVTSGGEPSVLTLASAQNTTFTLSQTLRGVPNGIYVFAANGFSRASNDIFSKFYTGQIFLNDNLNYLITQTEDILMTDAAEDGVNCHITGDGADIVYNVEGIDGYIPSSSVGCSYAFKSGRYQNFAAVEVKDSTLTFGVRNPGSGLANDWVPFGNVRMYFLGTAEQGNEMLETVLANYVSRAQAILDFEWIDTGSEFPLYPNMSEEIKTEINNIIAESETAESGAAKMEIINKLSAAFEKTYACRRAYAAMGLAAEELNDKASLLNDLISTQEVDAAVELVQSAWIEYQDGSCSAEEALAMTETLKECTKNLGLKKNEDGFYELADATSLVIFSMLVNKGETKANARITAPIDMTLRNEKFEPIGTPTAAYAGNFDGQLLPITNINKMLFGTINGAKIAGIAIASGEITMNGTTSATHCGSIVGTDNGNSSVLANSYSLANVNNTISSSSDTGGLVGKLRGTLKNCFFAGAVTAAGGSTGALVGSTTSSSVVSKIQNCFSYATSVTGGGRQGALVGWLHKVSIEENCYAIADAGAFPNGYTTAGAPVSNCKSLTAEEFASGMLAYVLSGGDTENPVFRQTIGSDPYPVFDASHLVVYQNGQQYCDGSPKEGVTYSNTQGEIIRDAHTFVSGICSACGAPDVEFAEKDAEGYYKISTPTDWIWFTTLVNSNTAPAAKARLQNEISLTDIEQKPIGTPTVPFMGVFDGQLKPITGVSTMLFGTINGAIITGVALTGGNVAVDATTYAAHCGSIVGMDKNVASEISNCYSLVDVTNSSSSDTGGLVGKLAGTLKNSFFKGSVTASSGSTGALVGSTTNSSTASNILNCYSYATSVTGGNRQGALVGWLHLLVTQENCYAIAEVGTFPNGYTTAGAPVSNCDTLTTEQFASGEACFRLNAGNTQQPIFFQTLGEDLHPVLDNTHLPVLKNDMGEYYNGKTGIAEPKVNRTTVIYDLSGRRVEKATKGLFIVNGRKILVK